MSGLLWKDGRFGWPLVVAVAFVSASLVASDYVWRLVQIPFETLLIIWFVANISAVALLIVIYSVFFRRRTPKA